MKKAPRAKQIGFRFSRNCISLFSLPLICFNPSHAQDWKWATPVPTGDACHSLSFVDSLNGWLIAGGSGIVVHTSDGGDSWDYQNSGIRDYYRKIVFVDKDYGWLAGGNLRGLVMRTTDGGKSWAKGSTNPGMSAFRYLQFIDHNVGYVAAERNYVCKTTDGGLSWTDSYVNLGEIGGMYFPSPNLGYVIANGFFRTTDSGISWQPISSFGVTELGDLYFADSLNGWFASQFSGVSRTTNGGTAWQSLTDRISLGSFSFPNRKFGWSFGYGDIYASSDSGKTWNLQNGLPQLAQGEMLSQSLGYACGGFGFIYRTTDGGNNWHEISQHVTTGDLGGVHMSGPNRVWAAGGDQVVGGVIIYSSDSGHSWTTQYSQTIARFQSLAFADSGTTAWACGIGGTAVHTTNGGESWSYYVMPVAVNLHKIFFKDVMHGWCAGDGVILRTTDGGGSWLTHNDSLGYEYRGLFFVDDKQGWAVGGDQNSGTGVIRKTTDGGASWTYQFGQHVGVLQAACFQDSLKGWVIGDTLLHTTDGGSVWAPFARPEFSEFTCMQFVGPDNGWMGCGSGNIYHSSNGGLAWVLLETPTTDWIRDLAIGSDGTGYAVGDVGVVLKSVDGIISGVKAIARAGLPQTLTLFQNFPNPFNPSTTIRYEIQRLNTHVTIDVFNILGQRVRALSEGIQNEGVHDVHWDGRSDVGRDCPSGIYFYRLRVDRTEYTKLMNLIR